MDVARQIICGALPRHIVSHAGTSQYSRVGSGVSACGLAALNCARVVLSLEQRGLRDEEVLCEMMKLERLEEILTPCITWSSSAHLDVEDILLAPIFKNCLKLHTSDYRQSNLEQYIMLLSCLADVAQATSSSSCAIITRPPEIIACIKLATSRSDIFVIFDSHPRPDTHPDGAAFIFLTSPQAAAAYLADLLKYDDRLLMDSAMQWQAQLLAHFSAHIFTARPPPSLDELEDTMMEASLDVLRTKARNLELESRNASLAAECEHLLEDVCRLEDEIYKLKLKVKKFNTSTRHDIKQGAIDNSRSNLPGSSKTHTNSGSWYQYPKSRAHSMNRSDPPLTNLSQKRADRTGGEDSDLARRLQVAFDQEDNQLTRQMHELKLTTSKVFDCGICFDSFNEDVVARVDGCGHVFCRQCINEYVIARVEQHRYPIICPTCMAGKTQKEPGVIEDNLLQQLWLSEQQHQIYVEMQLAAFSTTLHCRQCMNTVFVDKKEYEEVETIVCPLRGCNYAWCKMCSQKIEIGGPKHSCDGSSELKHLMDQRGWKYCPGCRTPAEKIGGCNHMTCMSPGCNAHFCYLCGAFIVQSIRREEIRKAVSAHYQRCTLFADVA